MYKKQFYYFIFLLLMGANNVIAAKEIRSSHPQSGVLLISDDHYSLKYQNQEGTTFPLYFYNNHFPSRDDGGEQYYLGEFSKNGHYAILERIIYFIDEPEQKQEVYNIDFIDMTTGCVFHSLNQQKNNGHWSAVDEGIWIMAPNESNPLSPSKINLEEFKGNIILAAGVKNSYLCNINNILDKNLNRKLLSEIQVLMEKQDKKYTLNNAILNQTYPHIIYGLITLLTEDNVEFFNLLALDLLGAKSFLDTDPHYLSSIIILEAIIEKFPDRDQTILNLADAYKIGTSNVEFQSKSTLVYRNYLEIMAAKNKEGEIPQRVYKNIQESH